MESADKIIIKTSGFFLLIDFITRAFSIFISIGNINKEVKTVSSTNSPSEANQSHSTSSTREEKGVHVYRKSRFELSKALLFIVPALIIGILLGSHILSYIRNGDDSLIAAPSERRGEDDGEQIYNRPEQPQRPLTVADALENILASSSVESPPSSAARNSTGDKLDETTNLLNPGVRVIRISSE